MVSTEAHIRALDLIHDLSHVDGLDEVAVRMERLQADERAGEILVSVLSQCLLHMEAHAMLIGLSLCDYIDQSKKRATSQWN